MTIKSNYTVDDFDPIKIRLYLTARGWEIKPTTKDRMLFFCHPNDPYAQFYLPLETQSPSFLRGIEEVLYQLTQFEKRPESEIVTNLMIPDNDIIRYRICSPSAKNGTISLDVADQFIEAVTRSLKVAVCDVVSPKIRHSRIKRKETDSFLNKAQFAQTENGSFVIKILCPLNAIDPPQSNFFDDLDIPFARRVTTHLMQTVHNLVAAIDEGREDSFIDNIRKNVEQKRISSDFCRAIADIQIWDDVSFELTTQWAPIKENDKDVPSRVEIQKNYFPKIAEIADAITPPPNEQIDESFIAVVDECKGDINESGEREGLVTLKIFNKDDKDFKANVFLKPDQYKIANAAHIGGEKHYLMLKGKLWRKNRSCNIIDITQFTPITDTQENKIM
jgi:hypothetical protein